MNVVTLTPERARAFLVGQAGLTRDVAAPGPAGARAVLARLRCIQLDPIDRIGTNADLVAAARVEGLHVGEVYDAVLPGHAFEHFAKERCLLPAELFPHYRDQAIETPWWRLTERLKRLDEGLIADVLAEVEARGPVTAAQLEDRGRVAPLDWSGWTGTSKASTMALEVLWTRCRITVHARTPAGKQYDVPRRSLPAVHDAPARGDFVDELLVQRVEASGLLSLAQGPWWSMLTEARKTAPERLVRAGRLELVELPGSRRRYLAPLGFRDRTWPEDDGRMRILGPLDPVLWDRTLVEQAFGFEYVWEVYKPAEQRRWGWYVCPLLHLGRLVGRVEARVVGDELVVDRVWEEPGGLDPQALESALQRHRRFLRLPT